MSDAPFEVLDALGLCRLVRRSADLDGSVPLRAARACVPLLEGNSFGWQLEVRRRVRLRRRWNGWQVEDDDGWCRSVRAAVPLLSSGLVGQRWRTLLGDAPLVRLASGVIGFWTGLLVRTRVGRALFIGGAGNRRNRDMTVREHAVVEHEDWVPLVLELQPAADVRELELFGETATLASIPSTVRVDRVPLRDAAAIGRAYCGFYDAAYFTAKRSAPTRKYRRLLAESREAALEDGARIVDIAGNHVEVAPIARHHDGNGPRDATDSGGPTTLVFRNAIDFEARFDGLNVQIEHDSERLAELATAIELALGTALGDAALEHKGALLYLAKYFTPHVPGEPHFFVKPAALVATPPGWATLVDGVPGAGYDVLRGVVRTDRFFAMPAVFALWQSGRTITVPAGTPLWRAVPFALADDATAPNVHPPLATARI